MIPAHHWHAEAPYPEVDVSRLANEGDFRDCALELVAAFKDRYGRWPNYVGVTLGQVERLEDAYNLTGTGAVTAHEGDRPRHDPAPVHRPVIPAHHLKALGERLDADGRVEFKNGSVVSVENETDLRITWPGTEETGYVNDCAYNQLGRAYGLALAGAPPPEPTSAPEPRRQPRERDWARFRSSATRARNRTHVLGYIRLPRRDRRDCGSLDLRGPTPLLELGRGTFVRFERYPWSCIESVQRGDPSNKHAWKKITPEAS